MMEAILKQKTKRIGLNSKKAGKLSKAGEFMRKYPNGIGVIVDMRAVMK